MMNTIDNDIIATTANDILLEHQVDINKYQEIMRTSCTNTAHRLRELLAPILHRWGTGHRANVWTYPMVGNNTVIVPGEEVQVSASPYGLDRLHWDLFHALFVHYKPSTGYLINYMEHIPLPSPEATPYLWVTSCYYRDTLTVDGTIPCSLTAKVHPLSIAGQHYHGPITQEYYDDVVSTGGSLIELVQNIPTYRAGPNGIWILDRDWDGAYEEEGVWGTGDL